MKCPKCGAENADDAQICDSCSCDLSPDTTEKPVPKAKISKMAIVSAGLAGLAVGLSIFLKPILALLLALLGVFTAIASIAEIRRTKGKLIGKSFAVAAIILSTTHIVLLNYLRIDAAPVPDDYTISDVKSADSKYNKSYELLNSLADTNGSEGAAIGLSEKDVNSLQIINKIFKKDDYDEICAGLKSNKDNILRIWQNAEKGREIINKLGAFPEIADLTEPDIEAEFPYLRNLRSLILLYRAYVCLQSYQGNEDIALKELIRFDNTVRKLNVNARSVIMKLICMGCSHINIETANFIINNPGTSMASLKLLSEHFTPLSEQSTSLRNQIIFEYLLAKTELTKISNKMSKLNRLKYSSFSPLKLNSTLRVYKNFCDRWISLEENRSGTEELTVWPAIYPKLPVTIDSDGNLPWYYKVYNPIGSTMVGITIPAFDNVFKTKTGLQVRSDLLQIILNKRLGKETSLKARAYSDEYIIDTEKNKIFSSGPDGKPHTKDDIKLVINPEVLRWRSE